MKTAVSIPDPVFQAAELEAKRRKVSRSRLYTQALAAWLRNQRDQAVTKSLDRYAAAHDTSLDPFWEELAWRSMELNMDEEDKHW